MLVARYEEKERLWSEKTEPIIRFWESESGECWGLPFFSLSAARFVPHSQRLILYFPLATICVTGGPKVLEFNEALAKQRATSLKADGKDDFVGEDASKLREGGPVAGLRAFRRDWTT
jgi:hypothetical protein